MKNVSLTWKHLVKLPLIVEVTVVTEEITITHIEEKITTVTVDTTETTTETTTITIIIITDKRTK